MENLKYRKTMEINHIWIKLLSSFLLFALFLIVGFKDMIQIIPIQVLSILLWGISVCFITFYVGYLIRFYPERWYYQGNVLVLKRFFHKTIRVKMTEINEIYIDGAYIYSKAGRIYLNTFFVINGEKKKIRCPRITIKSEHLEDELNFSMYDLDRVKPLFEVYRGNVYISKEINKYASSMIVELMAEYGENEYIVK